MVLFGSAAALSSAAGQCGRAWIGANAATKDWLLITAHILEPGWNDVLACRYA
jgi:hypothetical protein